MVSSDENPVRGADSHQIVFTEGGALYLLDTVTNHKNKIVDGLGKISEPRTSPGMTAFTTAQAISPRDLRVDPSCIGVALCPDASVTS
jgi:hypothetical protein